MRNFIFGFVLALFCLAAAAYVYTRAGFMDLRADQSPGPLETALVGGALDAYVERHAPQIQSPLQPTDANLLDGAKFYVMNCAGCHGGVDKKVSTFGRSFSPPAPQLIINPMDDPEWHIFYIVKHGVRWTGMPAWGMTVKDDELWKVTMFLSRVEKLPPAVQKQIAK